MYKHLSIMQKLGCKCLTKIQMAFQVYIYLRQEIMMNEVSYEFNKDIDVIFLLARQSELAELNIIIPVQGYSSMTLEALDRIQNVLSSLYKKENKRITLAICEPDSTTALYEVSPEFTPVIVEPASTSSNKNKCNNTVAQSGIVDNTKEKLSDTGNMIHDQDQRTVKICLEDDNFNNSINNLSDDCWNSKNISNNTIRSIASGNDSDEGSTDSKADVG